MDGLAFFLLLLGSIFLFIFLCACGIRICARKYDPTNSVSRAYRTDFNSGV